jgi:hydrogenase maturation factor
LKTLFKLSEEQVLAMSSTGTILAAVKPETKQKVIETLQKHKLTASYIGEFTENKERVLFKDGKKLAFPCKADDPYTMILADKATS